MSTRESGSDTWPRFAVLPGDNLDPGNAPEEDDVDHRSESPAWSPGSSAVGTGADPPDQEDGTGDQPNGDHPYADNGHGSTENANGYAETGNSEAPGFSRPSDAPGFGEAGQNSPD